MATESRWRLRAREIIQPVIDDAMRTSEGRATETELRKLLKPLYPFGLRQHHPYQIWLSEINKQMRRVRKYGPDKMRVEVTAPALFVNCEWCRNTRCLVCLHLTYERDSVLTHAGWPEWEASLGEDRATWLVFADWLEDNNYPALATAIRQDERNEP